MKAKSIDELRAGQQKLSDDFTELQMNVNSRISNVEERMNKLTVEMTEVKEDLTSVKLMLKQLLDQDNRRPEITYNAAGASVGDGLLSTPPNHDSTVISRFEAEEIFPSWNENSGYNDADVVFDGMSNPESKDWGELQEADDICDDKSDDLEVQIEVEAGKRVSPMADHKVFDDLSQPNFTTTPGLKSFPKEFNSFSTNEGIDFSPFKADIQHMHKVEVLIQAEFVIAETAYQVFDEMPELIRIGPYDDRNGNDDSTPLIECVPPVFDPGTSITNGDLGAVDMLIMPLPSFCMNNELIQPSIIQTSEDKVVKKGEDDRSLKQNSHAEPASKFDKSSEQAFTGLNSFSGKFYTISKIEEVENPSFKAGVNSSDMAIHSNVDLLVGNVLFLFDPGGCLSELSILLSFTPNMLSAMFKGDIVDDDLAKPPLARCVVENLEWYAQGMLQGFEIGEGYGVYSQSMFQLLHSVLEIGVANSVSMIMLNWGLHVNSPNGVEMNHVSTYASMKLCGYNVIFGVLEVEHPIGEKCVAQRLTETTQAIHNAINPLVWNVRGQWSDSRLLKTNIIEQILFVSLTKFGSGIFFAHGCRIWFIDMLRSPEAAHFGAVAFPIAGSFQVGNCTQARETLQGQSVLLFTPFQALSPRAASHIIQSEMENDCHTFIIVVEHFVWDPGTICHSLYILVDKDDLEGEGKGMYARGFEDSKWRQCVYLKGAEAIWDQNGAGVSSLRQTSYCTFNFICEQGRSFHTGRDDDLSLCRFLRAVSLKQNQGVELIVIIDIVHV